MRATAATLVKNGVAPKRAVSADLAPVGISVATATGINVQAMYPPTISTTPTAKRQPSLAEGLFCSTTSRSLPFSMAPCYARMGPQSVAFKAQSSRRPGEYEANVSALLQSKETLGRFCKGDS